MYFQFQIRLNRFEQKSIYAESYNKKTYLFVKTNNIIDFLSSFKKSFLDQATKSVWWMPWH